MQHRLAWCAALQYLVHLCVWGRHLKSSQSMSAAPMIRGGLTAKSLVSSSSLGYRNFWTAVFSSEGFSQPSGRSIWLGSSGSNSAWAFLLSGVRGCVDRLCEHYQASSIIKRTILISSQWAFTVRSGLQQAKMLASPRWPRTQS